jgi:hypothetical protein
MLSKNGIARNSELEFCINQFTEICIAVYIELSETMAGTLKDRFLLSALAPLSILFKVTGVFVNQNSNAEWKHRLCRFWTFFVLVLAIQSNFYIYVRRTLIIDFFFGSQEINVDRFIQVLVSELIRLSSLFSDIVVHLSLVFKIWPSVTLFLQTLETVDLDFGRPNLSPIKRYSIYGLIYLLFTVG